MSKLADTKAAILPALSLHLIAAAAMIWIVNIYYRYACFQLLGGFCTSMIQKCPDAEQTVLKLLKTQHLCTSNTNENILSAFGYQPSDFTFADKTVLWMAALVFAAGIMLFLFAFWHSRKKTAARIQALTEYLEKINTGSQGLLFDASEDEFSKLQDEIYKTVTALYQTRDAALTARSHFAENLANIAHQLKTPITAVLLTVQTAKEELGNVRALQIERQIHRLLHLEEALLLLSRIDAGTLVLDQRPTDVFTILTLAADHLYELSAEKGIYIDVPQLGEMQMDADADWTMEAIMNLMKNCMEAADAGTAVHCSYENNPLYTQIRIWDEGQGFAKEDIPHLFERFYRGSRQTSAGIGIGLSVAKAVIEMQNGVIRAFNLPEGGACFEIRFYSH